MNSVMEKPKMRAGNSRKPIGVLEGIATWRKHQSHKRVTGAPQDVKTLEEVRDELMNEASALDEVISSIKTGKPLILPKPVQEAPKLKAVQAKSVVVSPQQLQKMIAAGIAEAMKNVK